MGQLVQTRRTSTKYVSFFSQYFTLLFATFCVVAVMIWNIDYTRFRAQTHTEVTSNGPAMANVVSETWFWMPSSLNDLECKNFLGPKSWQMQQGAKRRQHCTSQRDASTNAATQCSAIGWMVWGVCSKTISWHLAQLWYVMMDLWWIYDGCKKYISQHNISPCPLAADKWKMTVAAL